MENWTSQEWLMFWGLILQIITAGVIFFGICFACQQVKATVAANKADNLFTLVAYLQGNEIRDAREKVHKLENTKYDEWKSDEELRRAAQNVASSYDVAAVAMRNGLIDPQVFSIPWKTSICSTYEVLKDYIRDRQAYTKDENYLAHYVGLARHLKGEVASTESPNGISF